MIESFRVYRTSKTHRFGKGWCLHIIDSNPHKPVQHYWYKDLMSLFAGVLTYPEGKKGK